MYLSNRAELQVIRVGALAAEIKTLESAFILAMVIDKKVVQIQASFLADQDIYLHNDLFCYSYSI